MSEGHDAPAGAPNGQDETNERKAGLGQLVKDLLGLDRGLLAMLLMVPVALTLLDYYGMPWQYHEHRVRRPMHSTWQMRAAKPPLYDTISRLEVPGPETIRDYTWWSMCCLLFLVLIPALVARIFAKRTLRDLGLKLKGTRGDGRTYLLLFVMFFPVIYGISLTPEFQATYPFFKPVGNTVGSDFWIFEAIYCLQFFSVEFFFRGFMVLGLKRRLGWASVLVMLAPYCMIHYYKPMPEALGAIGAGLILGALSWRTGTILYGWALHFAVALSMDLLALSHLGYL